MLKKLFYLVDEQITQCYPINVEDVVIRVPAFEQKDVTGEKSVAKIPLVNIKSKLKLLFDIIGVPVFVDCSKILSYYSTQMLNLNKSQ